MWVIWRMQVVDFVVTVEATYQARAPSELIVIITILCVFCNWPTGRRDSETYRSKREHMKMRVKNDPIDILMTIVVVISSSSLFMFVVIESFWQIVFCLFAQHELCLS